jgi:hypothetical protein
MKRAPSRATILLAAALPASVTWSCGAEPASEAPDLPAAAPAAPAPEVPPERSAQESPPVTLEPVNQSGVEGRATAIAKDDSVQFSLMVQGLPGAGEYPAHIHRGSCQSGGEVLLSLTPVQAESDGMGRSMTTLAASRLLDPGNHFVQVHGARGVLACGDVPAANP